MANKLDDLILRALDAQLVPFLEGSPGIGKSQAIRSVAKTCNLKFVDVRLSTLDPTDISGIPMRVDVQRADGTTVQRVQHIPSTLFPLAGDALPLKLDANGKSYLEDEIDANGNVVLDAKGKPNKVAARYDGWLVCFEELTSCMPAMQAASFRILLEREVGEEKLHPAVEMIATGNRAADKAVVVPMSTPMRTRLCFISVEVDNKSWTKQAYADGIDHRIITYLLWQPTLLNAFDPNIKQMNCAVPRTWYFANQLLQQDTGNSTDLDAITRELLQGVIGTATSDFLNFIAVFAQLPKIKDIIKDPANADMPTDPGQQYALTSVLSSEIALNDKNAGVLLQYVNRMEPELQAVTYMETFRKNRKLMAHPAVGTWVTQNTDMVTAEI